MWLLGWGGTSATRSCPRGSSSAGPPHTPLDNRAGQGGVTASSGAAAMPSMSSRHSVASRRGVSGGAALIPV